MFLVRPVVVIVIAVTSLDVGNRCYAVSEFGPVQFYKTVPVPAVLYTQEATSLLHCAVLCLGTAGCTSFDFRCQSLLAKTPGQCNVLSNTVSSTSVLTASDQCFVQTMIETTTVLPLVSSSATTPPALYIFGILMTTGTPSTTTTVPPTTTTVPPTTTAVPSPASSTSVSSLATISSSTTALASSTSAPSATIKRIFQNSVPWETDSYIMITSAGALVYRDLDGLGTGDTRGPYEELGSILPGYSDLPNIADVDCVMHLHDTGRIELYSGLKVYVWNDNLVNMNSIGLGIDDHLGPETGMMLGDTINWCAYRNTVSGGERHFQFSSNRILVSYSYNHFEAGFISNPLFPDLPNSIDVNIWKSIPDNIVVVTNKFGDLDNAFVLISSNLSIYTYQVTEGNGTGVFVGNLVGVGPTDQNVLLYY